MTGRIDGDPSELRGFAHELRGLTGRLDLPRRATAQVQDVRHARYWLGPGFEAFLTLVEQLPKPSDIDNAVDQFTWLASELDVFATVVDECQVELDHCRERLDQVSLVVDRFHHAQVRVRNAFRDTTRRTIFAKPPPGTLARIGHGLAAVDRFSREFTLGIGEGTWQMVKGLGMLAVYLNPTVLPYTATKLWQNRETIGAIASFAHQHPRAFALELGKATVDWETLTSDPARWLGRMVPDIVLTLLTVGSGSAASEAAAGTVRVLREVETVELLTDARIALHDSVRLIDEVADPLLRRTNIGVLKPLDSGSFLAAHGMNGRPTMVKDFVTGGWYSRMKLADQLVNGWPGMSGTERLTYASTRALNRGDAMSDLDDLEGRFDNVMSNFDSEGGANQ